MGVVARVEPGSGFDFVRKKVDGNWVASELTIEGSGRTLLFRKFQIKTVTTSSAHDVPFRDSARRFARKARETRRSARREGLAGSPSAPPRSLAALVDCRTSAGP